MDGPYRSLTQIIVESLRQRIFEGEYGPGARLNIADLAQRFGASPVPVREALRNLEAEGLIEFRPNRGAIVRNVSPAVVRELWLIRTPLESLAGAEAAKLATPDDIAAVEALVAEMENDIGTESWHRSHTLFHERLYAISGLPRLIQLVGNLRGQMRPYSKIYLRNRDHVGQAQKEHRAMVECLRKHNPEKMARLIGTHLERPARMAMAAFEPTSSIGSDSGGIERKRLRKLKAQ
jgi:DNA-binding GntR family transcriptional regulator